MRWERTVKLMERFCLNYPSFLWISSILLYIGWHEIKIWWANPWKKVQILNLLSLQNSIFLILPPFSSIFSFFQTPYVVWCLLLWNLGHILTRDRNLGLPNFWYAIFLDPLILEKENFNYFLGFRVKNCVLCFFAIFLIVLLFFVTPPFFLIFLFFSEPHDFFPFFQIRGGASPIPPMLSEVCWGLPIKTYWIFNFHFQIQKHSFDSAFSWFSFALLDRDLICSDTTMFELLSNALQHRVVHLEDLLVKILLGRKQLKHNADTVSFVVESWIRERTSEFGTLHFSQPHRVQIPPSPNFFLDFSTRLILGKA